MLFASPPALNTVQNNFQSQTSEQSESRVTVPLTSEAPVHPEVSDNLPHAVCSLSLFELHALV